MDVSAQAVDIPQRTVDNDVWDFLKYLGVLFVLLAAWQANRLVNTVDKLNDSLNELNTTVGLQKKDISSIRIDVSDISMTLKEHDDEIAELKRTNHN